ncbi:hypothetical protein CSPX01_12857 [Colletotrichum filicis]|nr:hypothetical protein CSPX01_12857 [Colletotrichum filicis]
MTTAVSTAFAIKTPPVSVTKDGVLPTVANWICSQSSLGPGTITRTRQDQTSTRRAPETLLGEVTSSKIAKTRASSISLRRKCHTAVVSLVGGLSAPSLEPSLAQGREARITTPKHYSALFTTIPQLFGAQRMKSS